jgi:hypothetical protein
LIYIILLEIKSLSVLCLKVPHFTTYGKNYSRRFQDKELISEIISQVLNQVLCDGLIDRYLLF